MTVVFVLLAADIYGQPLHQPRATPVGPLKGVVWDAPESSRNAIADLYDMADAGVEAVRSQLIEDDRVLDIADTLGLALFQEVRADHMSSGGLVKMRDRLAESIRRASQRAHFHPSLRNLGLGQNMDTSDPRVCEVIAELADVARREGPTDINVYYLGSFIESDRCQDKVDLVLIDGRGETEPSALIDRWAKNHDTPVGLGAIGVGIQPGSPQGTRHPGSPEARARYLEWAIGDALTYDRNTIRAVFVDRWRDVATDREAFSHAWLSRGARYGLHTPVDTDSLGLKVVRGFYRGEQDVFAFEVGKEKTRAGSILVTVGWTIVLLFGLLFYMSGWFRITARRYVAAHRFYCDFVKRGRDIEHWTNVVVMLLFSLCAGIAGAVILVRVGETRPVTLLLHRLSDAIGRDVAIAATMPWLLVLAIAALHSLSMTLWSLSLRLASPGKKRLQYRQAFMLVVWPRWLLLPLMILSITVHTLPTSTAARQVTALVLIWLLLSLVYATRMFLDFGALCPGRPIRLAGGLVGLVLLVVASLWITGTLGLVAPDARFLWHLATRT